MTEIGSKIIATLTDGTYDEINSTACVNDLEQWALDLVKLEPYAASMLDAFGKLGSGLLYGDILWMGNYDECRDNSNTTIANKTMEFEYSLVSISNLIPVKPGVPSSFELQMGVCLPKSCTADDVNALFNATISNPSDPLNLTATAHQNVDMVLNGADYAFMALTAILFVLVGVVTLVDVYKTEWVKPMLGNMSVKRNLDYFTKRPKSDKILTTFDGVRAISMTWVLLGHGLYEPIASAVVTNGLDIFNQWPRPLMALTILNATVCVDSFLLISAALFAYLFTARKVSIKQSALAVLFRFLRLTVSERMQLTLLPEYNSALLCIHRFLLRVSL